MVADRDFYSLYFSKGVLLEAELIAAGIARLAQRTVRQASCSRSIAPATAASRRRRALAAALEGRRSRCTTIVLAGRAQRRGHWPRRCAAPRAADAWCCGCVRRTLPRWASDAVAAHGVHVRADGRARARAVARRLAQPRADGVSLRSAGPKPGARRLSAGLVFDPPHSGRRRAGAGGHVSRVRSARRDPEPHGRCVRARYLVERTEEMLEHRILTGTTRG